MAEVEKFEQQKDSRCNPNQESTPEHFVLSYLRGELETYFGQNERLSLNSLSKRCGISEPTLRRIYKSKVKTLPNITTIFSLLTYLHGCTDLKVLLGKVPKNVSDFLNQKSDFIEELDEVTYSEDLTRSLSDPVRYLVFKLASNESGVCEDKVAELFGQHGVKVAQSMIHEELLRFESGRFYGEKKYFSLSHEVFVDHFKAVADFIKPHKHADANPKYSPVFSNFSVSLNKAAYSKILSVQRAANKKIVQIMQSDESQGEIPSFFLNAIDTLDEKIADEF